MWKVNNSKMHGLSEIGTNVPAFLIKLWKLVNSPETDELICWSETGLSFIINNPAQFSRELLSMYYKHNNMASFIRQLNMYGFHKIVSEGGGLRSENINNKFKDCMEFAHQYFIKDHPYLLENIKRKLPKVPKLGVMGNEQLNDSSIKTGTQSEILAKVLSDVNNLKGKQESWDAKLAAMKRENEALWRELAIFRQKHLKQEQIINRLIHFIVTIVQPSRNVSLRRKYPLMLNDIQPVKKITKLSGADTAKFSQGSPSGPTIHEIDTTDTLLGSPEQSEVLSTDLEFINSDLDQPKFVEVQSPEITLAKNENEGKSAIEVAENIPEDWLEVQLTEDNTIDPLTPIDPAKVNPAVAAATLKHLKGTNKIVSPIAITLPSVTTSTESGKKNVTEKKIIYLTGINDSDKPGKKNARKPIVFKLDIPNKKGSSKVGSVDGSTSPRNLLLDLNLSSGESPLKSVAVKRKISSPKLSSTLNMSPETSKTSLAFKKATKKDLKRVDFDENFFFGPPLMAPKTTADSDTCVPEIGIDDLDFLLNSKNSEDDLAISGEVEKPSKSGKEDSFFKLQSLYNGTISDDQLTDAPKEPVNSDINEDFEDNVEISEKLPSPSLMPPEKLTSEENTETTSGDILNFEPDSMAVVCQNLGNAESLTRELGSHVDSVQGEIDYLKEMLKGEGYSFDANSLPWLFNDDPLSYGVLSAPDEEGGERKNEEAGISGNELMTYGAPNLMDLVDIIGSTPSNQDWANILSPPPSSVVSDLATPAPSPSAFSFPSASKRRKI